MNEQEIFDMLADIECELFHLWTDMARGEPGYDDFKAAHAAARIALESFAKAPVASTERKRGSTMFNIGTIYKDTRAVGGWPAYHEIIGVTMDAIIISDFGMHVDEVEYAITAGELMNKIHSGLWIEQHIRDE